MFDEQSKALKIHFSIPKLPQYAAVLGFRKMTYGKCDDGDK